MATTVTAANLITKVREEITLNGVRRVYESDNVISSVNMVSQRIVRVPTSLVTVLSFGASVAAGTYVAGDIKYIRITNLDDTNFVTLGLLDSDGSHDRSYIKLEKGQSFIINNTNLEAHAANSAFAAFTAIDTINAIADTAAVDIEVFVASSQS